MKPVSPVIPGYEDKEFLLAKDQPEYIPVPTIVSPGEDVRFWSRWEFTDEEREKISNGGSLVYQQLTFGNPFQPIAFLVISKEELNPSIAEERCLCNGVGCNHCCSRT